MQVQIEVIKVSKPEKKATKSGGYEFLEVTYKDTSNGKVGGMKLVSFGDYAHVFKAAKEWKEEQIVDLQLEKVNGYWTWVKVLDEETTVAEKGTSEPASEAPVKTPAKQQWVPDEVRQRLIVRQSCLERAIDFEQTRDQTFTMENVLETAQRFVDWVFKSPTSAPVEVPKKPGRPKKVAEEAQQEVD